MFNFETCQKMALLLTIGTLLNPNVAVAVANTGTSEEYVHKSNRSVSSGFVAKHVNQPITVDGQANEAIWQQSTWYPIDQAIIGDLPDKQDFSGKFTLAWDKDYLYLLAKIKDDVLYDQHADPLFKYWDDDCLEVFIDEDKSGGNHQFNYNAFAYHIALDNQSVDIGVPNSSESTVTSEPNFVLLNDHITSTWQRSSNDNNEVVWELAIKLYNDSYKHELTPSERERARVSLFSGKEMGFMLAYCDNDGSVQRESFIGSTVIKPVNSDKNLGYITADVFDSLVLIK